MPRPGVDIALLDTPSAVSAPSDTGKWFAAGLTERGPSNVAQLVTSIDDYTNQYGQRVNYSVLYDAVDVFFREGGNQVYIARVVGPAATSGTLNIMDNAAAVSLVATAVGPGAWSSSYKVHVVAGVAPASYQIIVEDSLANSLENSGDLFNQQDAVNWAKNSSYIRLALGASANNPVPGAAAALSAGNDDRNNATDAQWQNALNLFVSDYGIGQVSEPGRTSTTAYAQIVSHCSAYNRVAILDSANTNNVVTLTGSPGAGLTRMGATYAPWLQVPGIVQNTLRTVPPCALVAGLIARNDPTLGPNRPSAGAAGMSNYVVALTQPSWNDTDRNTLNNGGVNVIRNMLNGIRVYGWRSLANPTSDNNWIDFGNSRLYMAIVSDLRNVGENFVFEDIDGQNGVTINSFHGACVGVLMQHFLNRQLFGDSPEEAFVVDTGPNVNTLATIQNLEIRANCYVKMSPFAEHVVIQIVKRQVTQAIT